MAKNLKTSYLWKTTVNRLQKSNLNFFQFVTKTDCLVKKFQYQSLRTDKNIDCCPDTILGDFLERFNDKEEQANAAGDGAGDRSGMKMSCF